MNYYYPKKVYTFISDGTHKIEVPQEIYDSIKKYLERKNLSNPEDFLDHSSFLLAHGEIKRIHSLHVNKESLERTTYELYLYDFLFLYTCKEYMQQEAIQLASFKKEFYLMIVYFLNEALLDLLKKSDLSKLFEEENIKIDVSETKERRRLY